MWNERLHLKFWGNTMLPIAVAALALACIAGACTVGNDDEGGMEYDMLLNGTYNKTGVLIGDIDAVVCDVAGNNATTRYSDIKTYMDKDVLMIEEFPVGEMLAYIPGSVMYGNLTPLRVGYVRGELPLSFDYSTDYINMEIMPYALELPVSINGDKHTVMAEFHGTDGIIKYDRLINWKYSFRLHLSALRLDGEPVEAYEALPDGRKLEFIYNAWVMTYDVFDDN